MYQDPEYDAKIKTHLDVNHGLDKVTDLVQTRLIESGWKDRVRFACRNEIVEYKAKYNRLPSVDELITLITPQAREMVPQNVKHELLNSIETILKNVDSDGYRTSF